MMKNRNLKSIRMQRKKDGSLFIKMMQLSYHLCTKDYICSNIDVNRRIVIKLLYNNIDIISS